MGFFRVGEFSSVVIDAYGRVLASRLLVAGDDRRSGKGETGFTGFLGGLFATFSERRGIWGG